MVKSSRASELWGGLLWVTALGLALWFVAAFAVLAAKRTGFEFNLEWLEGLMLEQTRRVLELRNLYPPPSAEYVPSPYPPLYFYVSALFALVFGGSYLPLRLVSALSTLALCGALYAFVRRESGSRSGGAMSAGLFAATWTINAYWFDLARVDMLSLALFFWGAYFLRFAERLPSVILPALLMTAAVYTKQSMALPVMALALWMLVARLRLLPGFAAVLLLSGLLALAAFYHIYGEWFIYYIFKLPASHGILERRIGGFMRMDWFIPFGLASMTALWYFFSGNGESQRRQGAKSFYAFLLAACIATAFLGRIKVGGALNAMIPLHAAVSLLCGLSLAATRTDGAAGDRLRSFFLAVYLLQLLTLAYNPTRFIPSDGVRQALQESLRTISAIPGDTYVMRSPELTHSLYQAGGAHACAVEDILREPERYQDNLRAVAEPFRLKAYDAIAINPHEIPDYCRRLLLENYRPTQRRIEIMLWQNDSDFSLGREVVYMPIENQQ